VSGREQHSFDPFPDSGDGSFSGHGPFAGADLDTDFDTSLCARLYGRRAAAGRAARAVEAITGDAS
jgi:hypothetical protein